MTFSVYNDTGTWIDISDYVVSSDRIPYISRNNDWTLRADSWSMEVAGTITSFDFTRGKEIQVKADGTFLKAGYIDKSIYDYANDVYQLDINNTLLKLKDKMMGYDLFHDAFVSGNSTQYWIDYLGYKSVQVLWILEKVFIACGLVLSVPAALKTTVLFTRTAGYKWNGRTITYADLYFDEYQLYCLGMQTAIIPSLPVTIFMHGIVHIVGVVRKSTHDPEIDCFDFVSEVLTSLKLTLKETAYGVYELTVPTEDYTVGAGMNIINDNIYDYNQSDIYESSKNIGYSWAAGHEPILLHWSILSSQRAKFYGTIEEQINEHSSGAQNKISVMTNFSILFADTNVFTSEYHEGVCWLRTSKELVTGDNTINANWNPLACRYTTEAIARILKEIKTNSMTLYRTVIENFIDIEEQTSNIVQESYQ